MLPVAPELQHLIANSYFTSSTTGIINIVSDSDMTVELPFSGREYKMPG